MGRLFWKFFISFWMAQLLTMLGVGLAFWLFHADNMPGSHLPPPHIASIDDRSFASSPVNKPLPFRPPLVPVIAGSVVSLCFAGLLAWYFSRPIQSLRSAFGALAEGNLNVRIGDSLSKRKDELSDLGVDFDRMAGQLERLIEGQRRLLHDVSHELRSPLARLQAAIDLMEQQPDRSKELITRIHRDTVLMDRLVGELLALARLNSGFTEYMLEEVDIGDVIAEVTDRVQIEIEQKQCQLETYIASPVVLLVNRELLHRALENVLRNAVRYSPEGGQISVFIFVTKNEWGQSVVIEISDAGPGVKEDELETIFVPFSRTEKSDWTSGFGLGLDITRRIVEAHGGTVLAKNREAGGLLVMMRFPIVSP